MSKVNPVTFSNRYLDNAEKRRHQLASVHPQTFSVRAERALRGLACKALWQPCETVNGASQKSKP